MQDPRKVYWEVVKHIFRYLKGMRDIESTFGGEPTGFVTHSNTDLASQNIVTPYLATSYS